MEHKSIKIVAVIGGKSPGIFDYTWQWASFALHPT